MVWMFGNVIYFNIGTWFVGNQQIWMFGDLFFRILFSRRSVEAIFDRDLGDIRRAFDMRVNLHSILLLVPYFGVLSLCLLEKFVGEILFARS